MGRCSAAVVRVVAEAAVPGDGRGQGTAACLARRTWGGASAPGSGVREHVHVPQADALKATKAAGVVATGRA